jgi:uncharacterized protein (UPF0335 family)
MAEEATVENNAQLRQHVERIEACEEVKKDAAEDVKEAYAAAKGDGFDTKILRIVVKRRALERAQREEQDALVQTYEGALN